MLEVIIVDRKFYPFHLARSIRLDLSWNELDDRNFLTQCIELVKVLIFAGKILKNSTSILEDFISRSACSYTIKNIEIFTYDTS